MYRTPTVTHLLYVWRHSTPTLPHTHLLYSMATRRHPHTHSTYIHMYPLISRTTTTFSCHVHRKWEPYISRCFLSTFHLFSSHPWATPWQHHVPCRSVDWHSPRRGNPRRREPPGPRHAEPPVVHLPRRQTLQRPGRVLKTRCRSFTWGCRSWIHGCRKYTLGCCWDCTLGCRSWTLGCCSFPLGCQSWILGCRSWIQGCRKYILGCCWDCTLRCRSWTLGCCVVASLEDAGVGF